MENLKIEAMMVGAFIGGVLALIISLLFDPFENIG